jgi:glutamate/tyrosine decarboxylase-like PLP-dependent enzyme
MRTASTYRAVLERAMDHALAHLENLDDAPVSASTSKEVLRSRLARPLADHGVDPATVIDELAADSAGGIIGNAGGRFFAWVMGGSLPSALAADWLTSAWDQNSALYACGPAEAIIEEVCGAWLKELLGLPARASFALVTGCQMAHVTCLAAARNGVLASRGWDVERKGLPGAPRIHVLTSRELHVTVERAVCLLGLGSDSIVSLPVDDRGRLNAKTLGRALDETARAPKIVVLQAGDLNIGAFDPFDELIPLAHEHDAWVHVDGAFGLWTNTSSRHRHLLSGVERADSWSTDGHKWLNVPYDCGYAFVADPKAHRACLSHGASYLIHDEDARDQMHWTPEWSRRGRGIATYAAIRQLGRKGISDLVERTCHHARELVTRIGALDGAEMLWEPQINQGLVRFLDPKRGATEEDHARRTDEVIGEIVRTGEAFFGGTTWRGTRCMRVSVCNWLTTDADVDRAVETARKVLRRL